MSHLSRAKKSSFRVSTTLLALSLFLTALAGFAMPGSSTIDEPREFSKCWEYHVEANLDVVPAIDPANVYFIDGEDELQGVDLKVGSKIWSSEIGGEVISNLLAGDGAVFVATQSKGDVRNGLGKAILRSVSSATGITQWRVEIGQTQKIWLGLVSGNVVAVSSDGRVSAFTTAKGDAVWSTDLKAAVSAPPHFDTTEFILGTAGNEIVKISGQGGETRVAWKSEFVPTAVSRDGKGLTLGDERGNLISISEHRKQAWKLRNGARVSAVVVLADSEYLAASHDNFIYKVTSWGDVKWKRRLSGRVAGAPLVIGNIVVAAVIGSGTVYLLDIKNGKILNRIETSDETTAGIIGRSSDSGFVISGPQSLSFFSRAKCQAK